MKTKEERVIIVNLIIKEISSRSRRFFHNDGNIAELFIRNGKIFYKHEKVWYGAIESCLSVSGRPKDWQHGGTLLALVRDFCDYIKGDDDANHNNGYGGLYCPYWGYPAEDMKAIQKKATELGYLKEKE
ncbi:hypothetical protein [Pedobacter sp. NJ-S-72]